jgi:hypothetical protein
MGAHFVNRTCLLDKFPGKGGWTNVATPEVLQDQKTPFEFILPGKWIQKLNVLLRLWKDFQSDKNLLTNELMMNVMNSSITWVNKEVKSKYLYDVES